MTIFLILYSQGVKKGETKGQVVARITRKVLAVKDPTEGYAQRGLVVMGTGGVTREDNSG